MKKPYIILILLSTLFLSIHCSCKVKASDTYCRTRYPVVLVHGLGFRDDALLIKYWGKIPEHLRKRGARVILTHQQAYASHRDNALIIKKEIQKFLRDNPSYKKVNIIAHSKGGIESRYMITKLNMADKVASLTTLATPHRGSSIADIVMGRITSEKKLIVKLVNGIAKLLGDKKPDSYDAGIQLTTGYMKLFNSQVPDMKSVYYQSYAAEIDRTYPNPLWRKLWKVLKKYEGPNDGLVSKTSAAWGDFRGVVKDHGKPRVSHADIIGLHIVTGLFSFKEELFFEELVHRLKDMGY
jgi:triacylglycerol esterase/lipase EstA (alpha/beta hydrolase family)